MKRVLIITNIPSYHQVDLFNAINKQNKIEFKVFYLIKKAVDRHWKKEFDIEHPHEFIKAQYLSKKRGVYYNPGILKKVSESNPDVLILTQYANISQQLLLYKYWLINNKVKLFFWSEKPGIPFYEVPIINNDWVRNLFRKISLVPIKYNGNIQVWGIGTKATTYFKNVFNKEISNFPYYLNTQRFKTIKTRNFEDKFKILFAGKLNERKGVDILINFLENCSTELLDNFEITILGIGKYAEKITELTEKIKINFQGFVERQEMPEIYSKNDIFLFPGRYDGWGMVINETMANGMVVMATKEIGAAKDCILNKENGIIIEPSAKSIEINLRWILANKNKLKDISKNAVKDSIVNDAKTGSDLFIDLIK